MYKIFQIISIVLLITSFFAAKGKNDKGKAIPEKFFEVKSGKTVMKISVNGGRIISYSYEGKEILTQSTAHENFGSTLWTAPQSNWGWPPYDVLDNQKYRVDRRNSQLLRMISKPDPKSKFQIEKSWRPVGKDAIQIEYLIRNLSRHDQLVGPWEITRVSCGGLAFFPEGGKGRVPESNLNIDLKKEGINWISIDKTPKTNHEKLFSTAREGWQAYEVNGLLFIKQFPDTKPENYSPGQGEVEIYVDKLKSYIELENQGEYQKLEPGKSLIYSEKWYIMPIPEGVETFAGNSELVRIARQQIMSINVK